MRVLFWSELYWPYIGGAEIFASRLMASLLGEGVEFLVITSHHDRDLPDEDVYDGVPIRRLPFRSAIAGRDVKSFVRAMKEIADLKRAFRPDLIHINAIGPSALFHLRTAEASPAPVLVTMQQEVLASQEGGSGTLMTQVLSAADWVVGCSQVVLDQLRAALPAITSRSSRIYNGVDAPVLAPAPLPRAPHLLCLGRLVPAKGFDLALRAFASIAPEHPELRFTIAGDGASREELESLARELGISGRVVFRGWVDPEDVPGLLNDATMVVMPSRREGMPIVAVQAALMARPIISTPAGGLSELVLDGETGVLVPQEDPPALANAMRRLLADHVEAMVLGNRARERVLTHLNWEETVARYHALYLNLDKGLAPLVQSSRPI